MPNDNSIPVTAAQGYTPTPESLRRVSDYLNSVPVKTKPSAVILIDPQQFASVAKQMTGGAPTRTAFTIGDRIYLNGSTLSSDSGAAQDLGHSGQNGRLAELALSHELAHMQDARPRSWQEAHDSIYNAEGQKIFQQWQKAVDAQQKRAVQAYQQMHEQSMVKVPQELQDRLPSSPVSTQLQSPQGRAYQAEQARVDSDAGKIQPAQAPIKTQLTPPPQSSAAPSSTPTPTPAPQPGGLLTLARVGAHIPSAALGALGAASRKV